ncbi:transcriptional regulator, AraC family [Emticicia oligotrophica DSM 17448]|uniref:Transcriptional regulator, AraC family n=1 Tax=Emticicia oligotrophica (strain DSM 17448 / CIP 109782 / MTCC 6937 / GPTSA100-15) TaxID=929562 RepID=A0ABN4ALA9_EMTOG|nr:MULTISPECIES: methylated-DNA--[protein]-cysteine S-methyltransferase [Emticicia]AFK02610.1 transcriptional regulator, AraC family [Emticicia oligotrophica DSM 17448]
MEVSEIQENIDFRRIEKAIQFIEDNFQSQPSLKEIADHVALSEFHFNRLFSKWAGTSPQRFMRFLTKEFAKEKLLDSANILEATFESGLSSSSRLHDLFVTYEAMTPAEFKAKGEGLTVRYGIHETPFGECLIALTDRGITDFRFLETESKEHIIAELQQDFEKAKLIFDNDYTKPLIDQIFYLNQSQSEPITLLLRGTNFQIKVWEALLKIPFGQVVSYETIANAIGKPTAQRAVGTAIGSNRLGYIIPCHRVLQKVGGIGGYRWGTTRKKAIIGWEMAKA